jgi:hypothetical protein
MLNVLGLIKFTIQYNKGIEHIQFKHSQLELIKFKKNLTASPKKVVSTEICKLHIVLTFKRTCRNELICFMIAMKRLLLLFSQSSTFKIFLWLA